MNQGRWLKFSMRMAAVAAILVANNLKSSARKTLRLVQYARAGKETKMNLRRSLKFSMRMAAVAVILVATNLKSLSGGEFVEGRLLGGIGRSGKGEAGVVMRGISSAAVRVVPQNVKTVTTLKDENDGCGSGAGCSLREAIAEASSGDTIQFGVTGTITLTGGELVIDKNLKIEGPGADQLTVSGNNSSRVFKITGDTDVTISGLTIANGGSVNGGGILNEGTLTMTNCAVSGNRATSTSNDARGGGIFNQGTLKMTNCTVSGNSASSSSGGFGIGGGILNSGTLEMTNCTVSGNSASSSGGLAFGGGIANFSSGTLTMTNCTVSENSALSSGGTGGFGGGIDNDGTLTMTNCTVSENSASGSSGSTDTGGGISNNGTLTMTNCTVSGNSASRDGGGIRNLGTLNLKNSIVANNSATGSGPDISGRVNSGDFNLIRNTSGISGSLPGSNNITNQDPKLAPLGNYGGPTQTHALLCGSPAIDRGNNDLAKDPENNQLTTDQRGAARIVNGTVDIGAFEANVFLCTTFLPFAVLRESYSQEISAQGGSPPYSFSLGPGQSLPGGLGLSSSGTISGRPTERGTFSFIIVATGSDGFAGACEYRLGVGEVIEVNTRADNRSCDTRTCSLRGAIAAAGDGDTIMFRLNLPDTITLDSSLGELVVDKEISIQGPGASQLTVSGGGSVRVFRITGRNVIISGLTIANGRSDFGGGISNEGTLTITNCTVSGNSASGTGGGGIANFPGGTLEMKNCTLSGNSTGGAGGGIINGGTLTMTDCTVSRNSASSSGGGFGAGGGIWNSGTLKMANCTLSENSASGSSGSRGTGGGILNFGPRGTLTMTNCTVSGNSASDFGGGITNGGTLTMANCTVSGNSVTSTSGDARGGGILNDGTLNLNNSIVANNSAPSGPDISGPVNSGDFNLIGSTSGISGSLPGSNNIINPDPKLAPLGNYGGPTQTHALLCGSPAINAGSNSLISTPSGCSATTDQRGSARIVSGTVDIGAFEANIFLSPTSLPAAVQGIPYSQVIAAQGGSPPYSFLLGPSSSLPSGLNFSTSGVLSGTPMVTGRFSFTVIAVDSGGFGGVCQYTLEVKEFRFDACVQDDSNPGRVLVIDSATGNYKFCCGGEVFAGTGVVNRKGGLISLQHFGTDRRVVANIDLGYGRGSATLQFPPGVTKCTIMDRNTRDNNCGSCASR